LDKVLIFVFYQFIMNNISTDSTIFFTGKKAFILLKDYVVKTLSPDKIFIITDENAYKYCLKPFRKVFKYISEPEIILTPDGELNKNLECCQTLWWELAQKGATRKSLVINFGGGMICDIGGFVASTFKRGLPFINIPTTLLAQVDASIGGKNGIDFQGVKNLLGVFSWPDAILIHTPFIETQSEAQKKSGFAEMVKIGLCCDKSFWHQIEATSFDTITDWETIIKRAVSIKLQVVNADPYETGFRRVLNFGHTIGHAFEAYSMENDDNPLKHGEAVAMGMLCETWLSSKQSGLPEQDMHSIIEYLLRNFEYYHLNPDAGKRILEFAFHDKKNEAGNLQFTLLNSAGRASIGQIVTPSRVEECLKWYGTIA